MPMIKIVENENIYLRRFSIEDADALFELDSDLEVLKYIHVPPAKNKAEIKDKIHKVLEQYETTGVGRLAIIHKHSEEFIGWAGLKVETEIRDFDYYDIGYRLLKKHWRKGYGIQSALLTLKHGFDQLNLEKICAAADVENIGSNVILNKIGMEQKAPFTFEGIDCHWYEMNKTQYDQRKN